MVNLSRRGFARLALGSMSGLWAPAARPPIAAIAESSGSSLAIPQPSSSVVRAPGANPPSEDVRWNRNGFQSVRPGKKLRILPE
jgi:hypothetical protein